MSKFCVEAEEKVKDNTLIYKPLEIINISIMTKTPQIIVEGKDDYNLYLKILKHVNLNAMVIPSDLIDDVEPNCEGVIKIAELAENARSKKSDIGKYILCIIDRDARFYRGTIPSYECMLVLQHYSYESHFISREHINNIVETFTNYPMHLEDKDYTFLESEFNSKLEDLYYISLEALKNACVRDYDAVVGYSLSAGKILENMYKDKNFVSKVMLKKDELDEFAAEKGINISQYKDVIKGKWLLNFYYKCLFEKIRIYYEACGKEQVSPCIYCISKQHDKCLRKLKATLNLDVILSQAESMINYRELDYIVERFKLLNYH